MALAAWLLRKRFLSWLKLKSNGGGTSLPHQGSGAFCFLGLSLVGDWGSGVSLGFNWKLLGP